MLFCKTVIHLADLSNQLRNFEIAHLMSQRLRNEFINQVNMEKKCILFEEEDLEEEFYNQYNLEPEEQSKEIQNKSISKITYDCNNWSTFLETFGQNGLIKKN